MFIVSIFLLLETHIVLESSVHIMLVNHLQCIQEMVMQVCVTLQMGMHPTVDLHSTIN